MRRLDSIALAKIRLQSNYRAEMTPDSEASSSLPERAKSHSPVSEQQVENVSKVFNALFSVDRVIQIKL